MQMLIESTLRGFAILLMILIAPSAMAIDFPTRPVRIVVPFGAGSNADIVSRYLAKNLADAMGQPFVVDNRPGAGSVLGTEIAASSAPDGYTVVIVTNAQTANESLVRDKKYALMRDLVPVAGIAYSQFILCVHSSVPANDLADLVKLAKAKPGQLSYASSGNGTSNHLAAELFKATAGLDIVHVPYKDSAQARTDLIAGRVQMMFDAVPAMIEHIRSGRVKALATADKVRSTVLPDVPTFAESGFGDFEATLWIGLMAPKGTPAPIIERLNSEIAKVLARSDVRDTWAKQATYPLLMSSEEFGRYLDGDIAKWGRVVKLSGAKID
jgi:tripartite-type tricarboxylate transporter receptor subunit TctC